MTRKEKDDIINRVINSELFSNKDVLKKLLLYLYEKSLLNAPVHEIDIAVDLFRRGEDFITSDDTIVRVNVHKLRLALERYTMEEGKKEAVVPVIPKGCYTLQFVSRNASLHRTASHYSKWFVPAIVLIILSLFLNFFFLFNGADQTRNYKHPIWSDYIKSDLPVCITLGDPFFFRARNDSTGENYIVRDIEINSTDDLSNKKLEAFRNPDFLLEPLSYSYFSQNNIWPLLDIVSVFEDAHKELHMLPLSGINAEDIKRFNHIVIANINSFGIFTKYLEKSAIGVKTNPRRIIVRQENDTLVFGINENVTGYYLDHAFLVKVPGPDNNLISLIGDFHASGNKGLSNYITRKELLNELEAQVREKYKEFPEFFEMVIEVTSYNYENFETKMIYFNKLYN
jgi:hypothetical protein